MTLCLPREGTWVWEPSMGNRVGPTPSLPMTHWGILGFLSL